MTIELMTRGLQDRWAMEAWIVPEKSLASFVRGFVIRRVS